MFFVGSVTSFYKILDLSISCCVVCWALVHHWWCCCNLLCVISASLSLVFSCKPHALYWLKQKIAHMYVFVSTVVNRCERWVCLCGESFSSWLLLSVWRSPLHATLLPSSLTTGCSRVHLHELTFWISVCGVPALTTTSTSTRKMHLNITIAMICILTTMRKSGTGLYLVRLLWFCDFCLL